MNQTPAFIRTYTPLVVSALVGWLASLGLNVSDEAQTALAVGIGGVAAAGYYAVVRALEKRWPALGVLLGSAQTPDSYSKGTVDHATQVVPEPDPADEADEDGLEDDLDDDVIEDGGDEDDEPGEDEEEITDDLDDDTVDEEIDQVQAPAPHQPRHSA